MLGVDNLYKSPFIWIVCLLILLVTACSNEAVTQETGDLEQASTLKIFTTVYALEDFTKKIGGELVEVINIIPPGVDAHTFEPTARGIIDIAKGDAFIYNGVGMEGFVDVLIAALAKEEIAFVEAAKGIELQAFQAGAQKHLDHYHGEYDPHVWKDPIFSIQLAGNIKEALIDLKPEAKEYFEQNYQSIEEELIKLNEEFQQMVEMVPNDTILVAHAGYTYWENRYGIKQVPVTGFIAANEPTQQHLQQLINYVQEEKLSYILFEQNYTVPVANVIREEVGAEILYLHNLEVYTEQDKLRGDDYFSLMRRNIEALKEALS